MTKEEIISGIHAAFGASEPPKDIVTTMGGGSEPTHIVSYFTGKIWSEITIKNASDDRYSGDLSSALLFMTDEAFKYFLPAYLLMLLNEIDTADLIVERVFYRLTLPAEGQADRAACEKKFDLFSREQKQLIARFIANQVSTLHYNEEAKKAYFSYWYQFDPERYGRS